MKKPSNYYCHKSYSSEDQDVATQYEVIQKIGEGAFGQVYKVFDPVTSQLLVLKRQKRQNQSLTKQMNIMMQMSNSEGFAKVKKLDTNKENEYVVMTCLGDSLGKIMENNLKLSVYTTKRIACQLLQRLKELHLRKYTHRDLKPENILLGNQNNPHTIFLVDFGLANSYRQSVVSPRRMYEGIVGTARYCSIAAHEGYEQFPKDDLESLGYVLVYLMTGTVPWKNIQTQLTRFEAIKQIKKTIKIEELCSGINCLKKYFSYIRSLKVNSVIDYDVLQGYFKVQAKQCYCYQFCSTDCKAKNIMQSSDRIEQEPRVGMVHHFII